MPPRRRSGPPPQEAAAENHTNADDSTAPSRCQRCKHPLTAPTSVARSHGPVCWHRRHAAAVRMPLLHCGCADPWTCRCGTVPTLSYNQSDNQIDGWADAARYLMDTSGLTPVLPAEVLRRLWQRGGEDRELAETLRTAAAASGGAVA
jgi:hypothetical protein